MLEALLTREMDLALIEGSEQGKDIRLQPFIWSWTRLKVY